MLGAMPNDLGARRMKFNIVAFCLFVLTARPLSSENPVRLPPASEMKMIGLVGGTSWYSTVEYYRYINKAVNEAYGNNTNPPLILLNLNQHRIHELQNKDQWDEIATILADAVTRLHTSGALAVLFCANTPYKVYPKVAKETNIPILHIADATGMAIQKTGLKKVGLMGTLYTMEDGYISDWLKEHYGIETLVPNSAAVRKKIHQIIQQEIDLGVLKPKSKKYLLDQVEELRQRGAQGIVLGCTELPLIIKSKDTTLPIFDTTLLHSQMAVDFILGKPGLAHVQPTP